MKEMNVAIVLGFATVIACVSPQRRVAAPEEIHMPEELSGVRLRMKKRDLLLSRPNAVVLAPFSNHDVFPSTVTLSKPEPDMADDVIMEEIPEGKHFGLAGYVVRQGILVEIAIGVGLPGDSRSRPSRQEVIKSCIRLWGLDLQRKVYQRKHVAARALKLAFEWQKGSVIIRAMNDLGPTDRSTGLVDVEITDTSLFRHDRYTVPDLTPQDIDQLFNREGLDDGSLGVKVSGGR